MLIEEVGKGIWISILQLRIRNSILFHVALRGGQAQRSVFQPISTLFPCPFSKNKIINIFYQQKFKLHLLNVF